MTIDFGHGLTATRDHTRAAAWRIYLKGVFWMRTDTATIARCIRSQRNATA
jgi:hypothetical protein